MPRHSKPLPETNDLDQRADACIADAEKAKSALNKQIEGLQRKIAEYDQEIADLHAAKRTFSKIAGIARAGRPKGRSGTETQHDSTDSTGQAGATEKTASQTGSSEMPSMAGLIRQLATSQTGHFTPTTISDLIRTRYPDVFKRMPQNYTSSNLWKLANGKKKPIRIVESGGPGGTNVYEANNRPPNADV